MFEEAAFEHFFSEGLVTHVVRMIKSGKEASVYLCRANPRLTGERLVVAKIYRPREHRNSRDDAMYLEGRYRKITSEVRAMQAKNRVGRELSHAFWVAHEWEALAALHEAGADVPRPISKSESAILMSYVGDEDGPAPQLRQTEVPAAEAARILDRLLQDVGLFLLRNVVHADLSSFNVLWWEDRPVIIDFPQAVDPRFNANAQDLLARDVRNLCGWAARQGVELDAEQIATDLWTRWTFADLYPFEPDPGLMSG